MKLNDPQFPLFTELGEGDRVLIVRADGVVGLADKNLLGSGGEETPPEPTIQGFAVLGTNTALQGDWGGTFGSKGWLLPAWEFYADRASLPANVSAYALSDGRVYAFPATDVRALPGQPDNQGARHAAVYYGGIPKITFTVGDAQVGKVAIYGCDFDNGRGDFTVKIVSLADPTKTAQATLTAEEYNLGGYIQFSYQGSFRIEASVSSGNCVFSGFFFD
jgi:hypothetical protein